VGFGVTADGAGDGGVKRKAENVVQDVVPTRFSVSGSGAGVGNVCKGDSGGPALATLQQQEVLVGIASAAEGACGASLSWETRADAYREWIDLAAGGDLAMVDRDAPHVVIERPAAEAVVGPDVEVEATATDDVAVVAVELLVDGTSVATLRVSPYRFPIQLQPGRHTLRAVARDAAGREGSAEVQVNVVARRHAFGEDCRTSEDCESRICLTVPGTGYCTQECAPPGEACPSTTRCVLGGNGRGLCARVPEVAEQDALDGGCAVGGASRSTPNLWTVALLGLGLVLIKRPARMAVRAPCKIPYQRVTMGDGTTLVTASAEQSLHGGSRGRGQPGAPRRGPTTDRNGPQSKGPSAPSAGPLFDRPEEPGHYHRRSCCHCESRGARSDP
jgi:MYXO-CTERM domain-containing protein